MVEAPKGKPKINEQVFEKKINEQAPCLTDAYLFLFLLYIYTEYMFSEKKVFISGSIGYQHALLRQDLRARP
jgi:hypothetical protein